jgi:hypothetical protein
MRVWCCVQSQRDSDVFVQGLFVNLVRAALNMETASAPRRKFESITCARLAVPKHNFAQMEPVNSPIHPCVNERKAEALMAF